MLTLRAGQACWMLSAGAHVGALVLGNVLLGGVPGSSVPGMGVAADGLPMRQAWPIEQTVDLVPPAGRTAPPVPAMPAMPAARLPLAATGPLPVRAALRPAEAAGATLALAQPATAVVAAPGAQPASAVSTGAAAAEAPAAAVPAGAALAVPGVVAPDAGAVSMAAAIATAPASAPVAAALPSAAPVATAPATLPVRYLHLPMPDYPPAARRHAREGLVVVRVRVGADGRPADAHVLQGSGFADLDAAALAGVPAWRFTPAQRDGQGQAGWIDVPVRFSLQMASGNLP